MTNLIDYALKYHDLGWSVIPVQRDKRPYIKWIEFQKKRPAKKDIQRWWQQWPKANIGVVTGSVSGIIVIDIDSLEGREVIISILGELPNTISQRTGKNGGMHLLFKHPGNGEAYCNMARAVKDVDIRGDGGYIIVAPSVHQNGTQYKWVIDPVEMGLDDLLDIPPEIQKLLKTEKKPGQKTKTQNPDGWVEVALMGCEKGSRNDTAAKLAGYYLRKNMSVKEVETLLETWNSRNTPPLEFKELRNVIASISAREGRAKMSNALCEETSIEKIQVLRYPDKSVMYNVMLTGHDMYAQMTGKTLGTFSMFKWKFMDIHGIIPANIKQKEWEEMINDALQEAEYLDIGEDETEIGAIAGVIMSVLRNNSESSDIENIDRQVCVADINGEKRILVKISTVCNLVRFEGERITRKMVGECLRNLGFSNKVMKTKQGRMKRDSIRCWAINYTLFVNRNENSIFAKCKNSSDSAVSEDLTTLVCTDSVPTLND